MLSSYMSQYILFSYACLCLYQQLKPVSQGTGCKQQLSVQFAEGVAAHLFLDSWWRCTVHWGSSPKQIWIKENPLSYIISTLGVGYHHSQPHGCILSPLKAMLSSHCCQKGLSGSPNAATNR